MREDVSREVTLELSDMGILTLAQPERGEPLPMLGLPSLPLALSLDHRSTSRHLRKKSPVAFHLKNEGVVVVQLLSHVQLFVTPWTAARQDPLSLTISQSWLNSCPSSR